MPNLFESRGLRRLWASHEQTLPYRLGKGCRQPFYNKGRVVDHSSAVVRPATHDDQIDDQGTDTVALELGSRELQVQGIDLLETRVMQQQGRIVRGQPRPLTELPFRHSTGETHDPNTF